jgi:poly-gamma-glutamate capsule biosynthesis protein CapA/YwtB (metallophosphatase superfamily)
LEEEAISILAVGDIMLGSTYPDSRDMPPNDGRDILKEVVPILRKGDITFGNLEGPLTEGGVTGKSGPNSYAFRTPPRYGRYLKDAGFDVFSVANNHANDFGERGRNSTVRTLKSLGIAHAGANRSDVAHLTVKGTIVAFVAFAHNQVSLNVNNVATAKEAVAKAARTADIVVVSFHGGAEGSGHQHVPRGGETYFGEARGDLRRFSHAVIDSGAHLVIGHGPHVVRGMERYKGCLIAYSLGNFATYGKFGLRGPTALSLILEVRLTTKGTGQAGRFQRGRVTPVIQVGKGIPKLDTEKRVISVIRSLSQADFGKNAATVGKDGAIRS